MRMSSGLASKIRGLAAWLDSGLGGRCLRGAMYGLTARQRWESDEAIGEGSSNLHLAILYIMAAAKRMPDRAIDVIGEPIKFPRVLYTDAAQNAERARIGAKPWVPGQQTRITVYDVPQHIVDSWGQPDASINLAELLAGLAIGATWREHLRDADVIWFVDNSAANGALVKSASPTETIAKLALQTSALLSGLGCRVWIEHILNDDNPADVLIREGLDDAVVAERVAAGDWVYDPPAVETLFQDPEFDGLWGWGAVHA